MAPSKRNCRIAQRIARAPRRALGAHIRSSCSRNVTVWQACSRHIQRRIVPPEPCRDPGPRVRRSPPRPRARGLVRFSLQPGRPASWLHDSTSSTRASGVRSTLIALQTDEQITPITTIKRHRAAGRVRHRPRSCEGSGGRSSLIIKDLDLYPQPPTNTHSPTLNSEEPHFCRVDKQRKYEYVYKHAYEEYLRLRSGYGTI